MAHSLPISSLDSVCTAWDGIPYQCMHVCYGGCDLLQLVLLLLLVTLGWRAPLWWALELLCRLHNWRSWKKQSWCIYCPLWNPGQIRAGWRQCWWEWRGPCSYFQCKWQWQVSGRTYLAYSKIYVRRIGGCRDPAPNRDEASICIYCK